MDQNTRSMQTLDGQHIMDATLRENLIVQIGQDVELAIAMCIHLRLRWEVIADLMLENTARRAVLLYKEADDNNTQQHTRVITICKGVVVIGMRVLYSMQPYNKSEEYRLTTYVPADKSYNGLSYDSSATGAKDPFAGLYTFYMQVRRVIADVLSNIYSDSNIKNDDSKSP